MDSNGKLFGKLSIVDLFVFLLVVAMVAGVAFRFGFSGWAANRDENTFRYTVRIDSVRYFTLRYHVVGAPVYDFFDNHRLGVVHSVRYEQTYVTQILEDGTAIPVPRPVDRILYIYIETPGFMTEQSYFTEDSFELRVGSSISMLFRYVQVTGTVANIEVIR